MFKFFCGTDCVTGRHLRLAVIFDTQIHVILIWLCSRVFYCNLCEKWTGAILSLLKKNKGRPTPLLCAPVAVQKQERTCPIVWFRIITFVNGKLTESLQFLLHSRVCWFRLAQVNAKGSLDLEWNLLIHCIWSCEIRLWRPPCRWLCVQDARTCLLVDGLPKHLL